MEKFTPIADLFEAHLTVSQLDRAVTFYKDFMGLPLARIFPERRVAFFWIGAPVKAMLGLWEVGTMPLSNSLHVAFQVALPDLHAAPARLQKAGIQPRDLAGNPTEEPVVLAWMPAASVYFLDPDNNLLEFITMLPDEPRPELGVLPWGDWVRRSDQRTRGIKDPTAG
jgi:lactoylglutathione lyase